LHLIEPLGFEPDDARLRRAGLDYAEWSAVRRYPELDAFVSKVAPTRLLAFSTRAEKLYSDASYRQGDALLFGPETRGLPTELLESLPKDRRLCLPMVPGSRSLNLSNAVAVTVYEGWRQLGFPSASNR
jgi:tRNA (cytidine/uridine-2'-O-)-methyltransferase